MRQQLMMQKSAPQAGILHSQHTASAPTTSYLQQFLPTSSLIYQQIPPTMHPNMYQQLPPGLPMFTMYQHISPMSHFMFQQPQPAFTHMFQQPQQSSLLNPMYQLPQPTTQFFSILNKLHNFRNSINIQAHQKQAMMH